MSGPLWVDTSAAPKINANLAEAADAFDAVYFRADTLADIDEQAGRCINALRRAQQAARQTRREVNR